MASEVEICNMALAQVRGGSINAMDQQIPQAQHCRLYYPIARDFLLENNPWNFNRKIVSLALLNAEVFNWRFVYMYPSDCMKVERIVPDIELVRSGQQDGGGAASFTSTFGTDDLVIDDKIPQIPYEVMTLNGTTRVIVCNEPNARIIYRAQINSVVAFPKAFYMALAALLGTYLAIPIAGVKDGSALKQECMTAFTGFINQATLTNAQERHEANRESEYIITRNGW